MNVLITCAGRRTEIIAAFKAAVGSSGRVLACDANAEAPALEEADESFVVPPVGDGYMSALLRICAENHVRLVIPALETELPLLAEHRSSFAEVGTLLVVSSPEVIAKCYDKLATARFLESCGLPSPRTFLSMKSARKAIAAGELSFPVIVKPRWGVSSIGMQLAEDDEELDLSFRLTGKHVARTFLAEISATEPDRSILIQERLSGTEYGLDIINDLEGRHVCTFIKRKLRMRCGQTDRAVSVADQRLEMLGRVIGEKLGHIGMLDCDVFVSEGESCVIDLNPRMGGGYPFSHIAGANFPAALVAWADGRKADPRWLRINPDVLASRCDRFLITNMKHPTPKMNAPLSVENRPRQPHANTRPACQVAIIGAGPYGLAAAAHLRAAKIETRVFGEAMEFWSKQMPEGMIVRSIWEACHISDPQRAMTMDGYATAKNLRIPQPIPLSDFIDYGRWFQQQIVPDLDPRRVVRVEQTANSFRLLLADGDSFQAQRVVVATGIANFSRRPPLFDGFPSELVSHTSEHRKLNGFGGKKIVVVGGGQSALESAALLHEMGAEVEVIARRPRINWLDQKATWLKSHANPLRGIFYPPTDVGPPGLNWIVATPALFRRLPRETQEWVAYRSIRPAGSGWLVPRLRTVPIKTSLQVTAVTAAGDQIALKLDDETERRVDHVMLATGYRVDVARYGFFAPEIIGSLEVTDGYPELRAGLESSVPGLHFLGAPAARSFGPVNRFVSGTTYAAHALTRRIKGNAAQRWNLL